MLAQGTFSGVSFRWRITSNGARLGPLPRKARIGYVVGPNQLAQGEGELIERAGAAVSILKNHLACPLPAVRRARR